MTTHDDPKVLQVFYRQVTPYASSDSECENAYRKEAWGFPKNGDSTKDGLILWLRGDGSPIFYWSVDLIVAGDERFVMYGPFDNWEQADIAAKTIIKLPAVSGYRIWNPHSFQHTHPKLNEHSVAYTDG
jgi:hypothetical protein